MDEIEQDYSIEGYYVSPLREKPSLNITYPRNIHGEIIEKRIPARRGRDDRPIDPKSKEKVRILNDRRMIQKNNLLKRL